MSTVALRRRTLYRAVYNGVLAALPYLVVIATVVSLVAIVFWGIVWPVLTWQRGIYAGFHYDGAKSYVQEVIAWNYGLEYSKQFRLGKPDVINTHEFAIDAKNRLYTGRQVRVFHLFGPQGVKWCVTVWGGGHNWGKDFKIVKGCQF